MIFKATGVGGVYDSDRKNHPDAVRYETVSFRECINNELGVMDSTAFSLCMDNDIPIIVFDLADKTDHFPRKTSRKKLQNTSRRLFTSTDVLKL